MKKKITAVVKKTGGKGNDVVAVNAELMAWLREHKTNTGISIVHFVTQAIEEKKQRVSAK